jgi:hypothetical protein
MWLLRLSSSAMLLFLNYSMPFSPQASGYPLGKHIEKLTCIPKHYFTLGNKKPNME